jgi:toxin FitB
VSYVVLDTDVASAILRRRLPGSMEARLTGQSLAITFVTVGELTSWTLRRNWGARRLADLTAWRRHVVTLPFDDVVATTWGHAGRSRAGSGSPQADQRHVGGCMLHWIRRATCDAQRQGLRGLR